MRRDVFEAIVNGYGTSEFDLALRMAQDPTQGFNFITNIVDKIVDVVRQGNQAATLSLAGHADRDDTEGRSHRERLAHELQFSELRVTNAAAHIHTLVRVKLFSPTLDLATLPFFDIHLRAPGASVLVVDEANPSEANRRLNRRVQARLVVFTP